MEEAATVGGRTGEIDGSDLIPMTKQTICSLTILLAMSVSHAAVAVCPPEQINSYAELSKWIGRLEKDEDYADLVLSACTPVIGKNVGFNRGLEKVWNSFPKMREHDLALIPLLADPCKEFQCYGLSSEQFVRAATSYGEFKRQTKESGQKNLALLVSLIGAVIASISLVISILKFRKETEKPQEPTDRAAQA